MHDAYHTAMNAKPSQIFFAIIVYLAMISFSIRSYAQYITGTVASGAGRAGRASTEDGEQFILNPATVVDASPAVGEFFYASGSELPGENDQYYGLTVTDNSPGLLFAGGYLYVHRYRTFQNLPSVREDYHQLSMGQFITTHISLGAAVTYLRSVLSNGNDYIQWNGHLGVLYNPLPYLGLAFVSYNDFGHLKNVPAEIQERNELAIGATYLFSDDFRLRTDILEYQEDNPKHFNEYQFGFESKVEPLLWARIGYDRNVYLNQTYWTAGFTFNGPRLKADYYFQKDVASGGGYMQGVDLRLPFW